MDYYSDDDAIVLIEKYFKYKIKSSAFSLTEKIFWLNDNVGSPYLNCDEFYRQNRKYTINNDGLWDYWTDGPDLNFYFKNPEDAMKFKLFF